MTRADVGQPRQTLDRRAFVALLASGVVAAPAASAVEGPARTSLRLAYTSFAVRLRQGRESARGAAPFDAEALGAMCRRFGAAGAQVDFSQVGPAREARTAVREAFAHDGLSLEVSMPSRCLESPEAYAEAVTMARALGASRARVALLSGRRYETFETAHAWAAFASRWREILVRMRPEFERHAFPIGIENHKDWLAPELVALLDAVDSRHVGACVDFGNNLALLEDPDDTIAQLAPYAVTTHVKDMAVRTTADGFEVSEVPLGQGLLPLGRYVAAIRAKRPDATFCLEMMTRDPLAVRYRTERYWVPFDPVVRDPARLRAFETRVLSHARATLPRVNGLPDDAQRGAEDDNVAACVAYARDVLKLEPERA